MLYLTIFLILALLGSGETLRGGLKDVFWLKLKRWSGLISLYSDWYPSLISFLALKGIAVMGRFTGVSA